MKAKEESGQFSLFDLFDGLFEPEKPEAHIEQVLDRKEDYLAKGQRLENLAKEDFGRRLKEISVTKAEEAVYGVKFTAEDSLIGIMRKMARHAVRPVLRAMETPEDLSGLLGMIDSRFTVSIDMPEQPLCGVEHVIRNRKNRAEGERMLLLRIEEADYPELLIWGTKIAAHPANRKNVMFRSGYVVSDIAEVLSLLIILSEVLKNQENAVFLEAQNALIGRYAALHTGFDCGIGEMTAVIQGNSPVERLPDLVADALKNRGIRIYYDPAYKSRPSAGILADRAQGIFYVPRWKSSRLLPVLWNQVNGKIHFHDILNCDRNGAFWGSIPDTGGGDVYSFLASLFLSIREERVQDIQTVNYYKSLSTGYAKSFQKKKNIPVKTVQAMETSEFNRYFGFVEYDELVDLEKVREIADEFIAVREEYLPFIDSSENSIRFRRLGNHKAAGLYYPSVKCLCVDIHNPYSLLHEYGHLIDYQNGSLSRGMEFECIRGLYRKHLLSVTSPEAKKRLAGNTKYNLAYYLEPTEMFARSFEIYMAKIKGIKNSLLPEKFGFEYPDEPDYLKAVENYFNALFGRLRCSNAA